MSKPPLHFSRDEFYSRIAKTRSAMEKVGLELLIISDPSNMNWLTGYDGWSFYTHQAVLLSVEDEPVWWGRGMDALGAKRTVFMQHENIVGYSDHYVQNPECHPMETLAELIRERGWVGRKCGLEMDNYYFSAAAWETLRSELPETSFQDTSDYPAIVPMAPSGMDATAPHLTWDARPLEKGESTFFEIAGAHRRYQCPQSRTLFLGKPPQKYLDAEKAVLEAVEAGLEQAKPGKFSEDIAIAFYDTLERYGFQKDSRTGYAIGVSYPPDWGERTMSFRRGDKSVLQPGMTFHFMPALWLDDGGLEITEPILITETGVECLCKTPRKLFVKD